MQTTKFKLKISKLRMSSDESKAKYNKNNIKVPNVYEWLFCFSDSEVNAMPLFRKLGI